MSARTRWTLWLRLALGLWLGLASLWSAPVQAHSSSNAYLTLSAPELTLRADLHLRDVDLVWDLDQNRDGQVTWAETRARSAELQQWLEQGIRARVPAGDCARGPLDLQAANHADGTYLSAQWTLQCPGLRDMAELDLTLHYDLMFARDNLHRGLLKVDLPQLQSSAILSPERPQAQVAVARSGALHMLGRYLVEGVWHIWIGIDHILFLLSLLVLAPLQATRARLTRWQAAPALAPVVRDVVAVVTAFTVAHSITLGLAVTGWLTPSPDWVEPAIALSVVLAALNNLMGWSAFKRWPLAFVFGLVHGFGFANVLLDLGLPASALAASLAGFNIGVELGQLAIVLVFLPLAWWLRATAFYRWAVVVGGSLAIVVLGLVWTLQRTGLIG